MPTTTTSRWKIEIRDDDTGEWSSVDDLPDGRNEFSSRYDAEQELRHLRSRCAHRLAARVVPA